MIMMMLTKLRPLPAYGPFSSFDWFDLLPNLEPLPDAVNSFTVTAAVDKSNTVVVPEGNQY